MVAVAAVAGGGRRRWWRRRRHARGGRGSDPVRERAVSRGVIRGDADPVGRAAGERPDRVCRSRRPDSWPTGEIDLVARNPDVVRRTPPRERQARLRRIRDCELRRHRGGRAVAPGFEDIRRAGGGAGRARGACDDAYEQHRQNGNDRSAAFLPAASGDAGRSASAWRLLPGWVAHPSASGADVSDPIESWRP